MVQEWPSNYKSKMKESVLGGPYISALAIWPDNQG